MKKENRGVILIIGILLLIIIAMLGMVLFGMSNEYILIDGDDIVKYEIVDGNTIIIYTENETYEVELFDDVVDFTVNSNITIELVRGCIFGESVYGYRINRIIKIPDVGGIE